MEVRDSAEPRRASAHRPPPAASPYSQVLVEAGLANETATFVMLAAHKSGRGVVGYFKAEEAAAGEALRAGLEDRGLLVRSEPWEYYGDGGQGI